jgi:ribonucleoside-triphosphate reductase
MLPICFQTKESGFQFCNLTETNGGYCNSKEKLFEAVRAGAILGTLQAGYTNFHYLSDATRRITEREALIGVSITGWMNNPHILFDEPTMIRAAEIVKQVNKEVAKLIGINQAARTTCAKPSGNASVILGTWSGIHGAHAKRFIRNVQMNEQDAVLDILKKTNPAMVEKSVWSTNGTDYVVSFPIEASDESLTRHDLLGVKQLEYVKKAQQFWVEAGTNEHLSTDRNLRHNISNTISVDDWDEVEKYIYDNMQYFAGISLLHATGDKAYAQAPFTEVLNAEEILQKYGPASMSASGLIVDALHAFNNNLWQACDSIVNNQYELSEDSEHLLKKDWIRRAKKFAKNYFDSNVNVMIDCLKDCHNLHRWTKILNEIQDVDFSSAMQKQIYVDADTMGSQACAGGACEVTF